MIQKILAKKKQIIIVIALLNLLHSYSQQNNALYFLNELPQINKLNPAYQTSYDFFIGVPAVSSIDVSFYSNALKYSNFIAPQGNTLVSTPQKFVEKMGNFRNYYGVGLSMDLISFGIRLKKTFLNFDLTAKLENEGQTSKEIAGAIAYGEAMFGKDDPSFDTTTKLNFNSYIELSVGLSHQVDENLTVGAKAKLLQGIANIKTLNSEFGIYEIELNNIIIDDNYVQVRGTGDFNISVPISLYFDEEGKIERDSIDYDNLTNFSLKGNKGFAFDIGVIYKLNEQLTLSGSILDLGYLRWNRNSYYIRQEGSFISNGFDTEPINVPNLYFNKFNPETVEVPKLGSRSLKKLIVTGKEEKYISWLSPKIYTGINYKLNENLNFGALLRSQMTHSIPREAFTLSTNASLGKWFTSGLSYTIAHRSYNNVGISFGVKAEVLQFYIINDNILGYILPQHTKYVNTRFGFNLLFGNTAKNKSKRARGIKNTNECGYPIDNDVERENKGILNNHIQKNPIGKVPTKRKRFIK